MFEQNSKNKQGLKNVYFIILMILNGERLIAANDHDHLLYSSTNTKQQQVYQMKEKKNRFFPSRRTLFSIYLAYRGKYVMC